MKIVLAIPTYNAGNEFEGVLKEIDFQREYIDHLYIIDSGSSDRTVEIANKYNCEVEKISAEEFGHAKTRSYIAEKFYKRGYDYLIFMTQDVFLQKNSLANIIKFIIKDKKIGAVYGKQEVDLSKGNLFEYFARSFNYGKKNLIKKKKDIKELGIKTIFSSDAFIIYNLKILMEIGWFGDSDTVSEDMVVAHKLITNNYQLGYCSSAKVYHTHNYTLREEFVRYKKIGKFYRENKEMVSKYGKTTNEGIKLVHGEILFLLKNKKFLLIPESILRNICKFLGHKIGAYYGK